MRTRKLSLLSRPTPGSMPLMQPGRVQFYSPPSPQYCSDYGMPYDSDKKGLSASRRPFEVLEQAQNFRSSFRFCLSKFCHNPGVHQSRGLTPYFVAFGYFSVGINYGELKLVSILTRDAVLLGHECTTRIPAAGVWGGNWMTIHMGGLHLFHAILEKLHF